MAKATIRFKVVTVIVALLVASVSTFILVSVLNQRANLLDATRANLSVNNDMLNRVIRNLMLSGEASTAIDTLEDVRDIAEFEEVAVFRVDGTRAFSDYVTLDLVNDYQDVVLFERTPRVEADTFDGNGLEEVIRFNSPFFYEDLSQNFMEFSFPILNTAQCRLCHGDTQFVRGVAHYRVSLAGITSRIQNAGLLLSSVFAVTGSLIAVVLITLMQRIIVRPVRKIGVTVARVGSGDLKVEVPVSSNDEIGDLSTKINDMIVGLRDRDRLVGENAAIDARNRENRKYLDNIAEGLVLIDRNLDISEQYSSFMEELFETDQIAGRNFVDFVYPADEAGNEERKELEQFLGMVFDAVTTEMEMIQSVNPLNDREVELLDRRIVFDVRFVRIFDGESVQNVMAIFIDRTSEVEADQKLDAERERSRTEVATINAVMKAGAEAFVEFRDDATSVLHDLKSSGGNLDSQESFNALFRKVHSLKGEARYMEFPGIASAANRLEDYLANTDNIAQQSTGRAETLGVLIDELDAALRHIEDIENRFRSFVEGSGGTPPERFAKTLGDMIQNIAAELGKDVQPVIKIDVGDVPILRDVRDPVIHLVRNALDHGLEEELERVAAGKSGHGTLLIRMTKENDVYIVEVSDNGRGIDFRAVEQRAIDRGVIPAGTSGIEQRDLIRILFSPSFSSRDEVTELSGRGVGLDAVYDKVSRLGGRITVSSVPGKGARFVIRIPVRSS